LVQYKTMINSDWQYVDVSIIVEWYIYKYEKSYKTNWIGFS
jgi:hypothetical protein